VQRACPNAGNGNIRGPMMGRGGFGGGYRGGFSGGPRPMCYKCGGPNHYARDCQAQAMKCYACGKLVNTIALDWQRFFFLTHTGTHFPRLHCA
jgi:cellular nucleic acid-binding protein